MELLKLIDDSFIVLSFGVAVGYTWLYKRYYLLSVLVIGYILRLILIIFGGI